MTAKNIDRLSIGDRVRIRPQFYDILVEPDPKLDIRMARLAGSVDIVEDLEFNGNWVVLRGNDWTWHTAWLEKVCPQT